jgi:hypothetical protein
VDCESLGCWVDCAGQAAAVAPISTPPVPSAIGHQGSDLFSFLLRFQCLTPTDAILFVFKPTWHCIRIDLHM